MCILLRRSVNYIQITANDIPIYPQSQDVVRIPLEPYDIAEMRRIGEDGVPLSLQTVLEFRSSDSLSAISAFYQTYWQQHGFTCNTTPPLTCRKVQQGSYFEHYGEELTLSGDFSAITITLHRFMSFE